jgi:hypothetical protein
MCLTHGSIAALSLSAASLGFLGGASLAALVVWVAWVYHVRRLVGGGR